MLHNPIIPDSITSVAHLKPVNNIDLHQLTKDPLISKQHRHDVAAVKIAIQFPPTKPAIQARPTKTPTNPCHPSSEISKPITYSTYTSGLTAKRVSAPF